MKKFLFRNPWTRTLFPSLSSLIIGVMSNIMVAEATLNDVFDWYLVPKTSSFYVILISFTIIFFYEVGVFKFDKEVINATTPEQYNSYLSHEVREESAKRVKQLIKKGDLKDLSDATKTFKSLFGEKDK